MDFTVGTTVHAPVDATVEKKANNACVGLYLVLRERAKAEPTATFMTFEHLSSISVSVGERVSPGQVIAQSGESGSCITGPHLHFQRGKVVPTFDPNQDRGSELRMAPIDSVGVIVDEQGYESTNAGVGYSATGDLSSAFKDQYLAYGNWGFVGRPWRHSVSWTPCRWKRSVGTHWRFDCDSGGFTGKVQTFSGPLPTQYSRALMRKTSGPGPFMLHEQFLWAYTHFRPGQSVDKDFVHWIGYPTNDVVYHDQFPDVPEHNQYFENGQIRFFPGVGCWTEVHVWPDEVELGSGPASPYAYAGPYCGEPLPGEAGYVGMLR